METGRALVDPELSIHPGRVEGLIKQEPILGKMMELENFGDGQAALLRIQEHSLAVNCWRGRVNTYICALPSLPDRMIGRGTSVGGVGRHRCGIFRMGAPIKDPMVSAAYGFIPRPVRLGTGRDHR